MSLMHQIYSRLFGGGGPKVTVNYIDVGTHEGQEIDMFVDVCNKLKQVTEMNIYGIEANPRIYESLLRKYSNTQRVEYRFYNFAVSNSSGVIPLYIDENDDLGSSIYASKSGVSSNAVQVAAKRFSNWFKQEFEVMENAFTILKANIEGAEWDLVSDLDESDMFDQFDLICASSPGLFNDIGKCEELRESGRVEQCSEILRRRGIVVKKWCHGNPQLPNVNMQEEICRHAELTVPQASSM